MNLPIPLGSLCPPPARVARLHFDLLPFICHLLWGAGVAASLVLRPASRAEALTQAEEHASGCCM